jgi:ribose transport system permease protein
MTTANNIEISDESALPAAAAVAAADGDARVDVPTSRLHTLSPWILLLLLVLVATVFSVLKPAEYFTTANLRTIAVTQAVLAILATATLLPLVIGNFDVSVGANLAVGGVLVAGLGGSMPALPAVLIAILVCGAIGLVNGILVAKLNMNAFIATLGMSTILGGAVLWYTNGAVLYHNFPTAVSTLGNGAVLGVPVPVIILAVVASVAWYVLEQTPLGRYLYAIGGSREAARLSGLNVPRLTILTFVLTGLVCGLAGVVQAGTLGAGNPTVGPSFLLPAFAAVFLGATAIKIGAFNVRGTLVAVYLLAAGVTGLEMLGVPSFVEPIFSGVALIVGVALVGLVRKDAVV